MSKKQKAILVWAVTQAADVAIQRQGKKINAPQWQIEIAKVVIAIAIAAAI
ncbi:hypothetical protein ABIA32_002728 [Streptacidiphilus sp. MAP12-20]|uniref:hypothetical protein n=1 Tax=Streptacidiphilus sp. MAP12-20 TaxID=3156299 RepID=UPI0035110BEB